MAQSMRKQLVFAAIESAYQQAEIVLAADAILCSGLSISPLEGSSISRDFIRPWYGNAGEIRVENYVKLDFETELAGNSTAGSQPIWSRLLKICNLESTGLALAGGVGASSTATAITLSNTASSTDSAYVGQYLFIGAESRKITGYVGATKIATVSPAFSSAPSAGTLFSLGVEYKPVSSITWGNAAASGTSRSATLFFELDGVKHGLKGARGTFSIDMSAKKVPKIKWSFTGLLIPPDTTTIGQGTFTSWGIPVPTGTTYTKNISLHGNSITAVDSLTLDIANEVKYRQLIGAENVYITDRKPKGSISFESTGLTPNWFTTAMNNTSGVFSFTHGITPGNAFMFTMPVVQPSNPKYADSDGIAMINMDLLIQPSSSGNDEISIIIS